MNHATKYIISFVLTAAGAGLLVYGGLFQRSESRHTVHPPTGIINVQVDLQLFEERMAQPKAVRHADEPKVLPLMVLTTNVCPPCINNVAEYADLFKEHSLFFESTLVFVGKERSAVERFVLTSGLGLPFKLLHPEEAGSLFRESEQNLIFIERGAQTAFYNAPIPNAFTSIAHKEEQLLDVSGIWESMFAGNDKSGNGEEPVSSF